MTTAYASQPASWSGQNERVRFAVLIFHTLPIYRDSD